MTVRTSATHRKDSFVASQPKSRVRPVRVYVPDSDLHTTVVRGVGFRASYSDGTKGKTRKTYREARQDAREHKHENAAQGEREAVTPTRGTEAS